MNKSVLNIVLFFLFAYSSLKAQQNLIYNGSFEEFSSCPISNDLNNFQLELAVGWKKPSLGTSDYFNACNHDIVGVPSNFWGYQNAYHGLAYVGLVPIAWNKSNYEITGQEYIQTKLTEDLSPCQYYSLTFYVSCSNFSQYGVGKIGAYFSQNSFYENTTTSLPYSPQITNLNVITDTLGWTKIEGNYLAQGGEQYLTLGYFGNDLNEDTVFIQNMDPIEAASYYYIDSVSLIRLNSFEDCNIILPNVFTPNGDNINDFIDFNIYQGFKDFNCKVLNRWGDVVYDYKNDNSIWFGKNTFGYECSDGVYFLILNYQVGENVIQKTGFIQLIR